MTASAGGRDLSQRLSKIETAISRRKTIEFTYYTMERDETEKRKVDPFHLVFRGGQFYLIGHAHERDAVRVFRLSRIQGKVGYASKAEHDFSPPEDFDRRDYGQRADWQLGEIRGTAKIFVRDRIAWLIERDFGAYGELRPAKKSDGAPGKGSVFETDYASPRELIAWVLRWRQNAQVLEPDELREEADEPPRACSTTATTTASSRPRSSSGRCARRRAGSRSNGRGEAAIRPERFARLVTLAGLLIESAKGERAARRRRPAPAARTHRRGAAARTSTCSTSSTSAAAPTSSTPKSRATRSRSTPSPTATTSPARRGCCRSRPRRWSRRSTSSATTCRRAACRAPASKIVEALGHDPSEEGLEIASRQRRRRRGRAPGQRGDRRQPRPRDPVLQGERGPVHQTRGRALPAARTGARAGTSSATTSTKEGVRHFKLDRIKEATHLRARRFEPRPEVEELAGVEGWMTHGEVPTAHVARVWVSPERARWLREERTVVEELADGAVVVELPYAGTSWLVREILARRRRPRRARARGRPRGDRQRGCG